MFEFKRIRRSQVEMVMEWRCSEHVTRYMTTDMKPDLIAQLRWFDKVDHAMYWMIYFFGDPIGIINLADYCPQHYRTSFGFYIGKKEDWLKGPYVLPLFYNYLFDSRGLRKIVVEVFAENTNVVGIHILHGYREVGILNRHVYKNGKAYDIIVLELDKESWMKSRSTSLAGEFGYC